MPELDSANGTIYVPIQCPKSYCPTSAFAKVVDIVSSATCNGGRSAARGGDRPGDNRSAQLSTHDRHRVRG